MKMGHCAQQLLLSKFNIWESMKYGAETWTLDHQPGKEQPSRRTNKDEKKNVIYNRKNTLGKKKAQVTDVNDQKTEVDQDRTGQ